MARTLSVGGATHDLFGEPAEPLTSIEPGSKIRLRRVTERAGGGAANSSVGLARLGCQAHFAGVVGDDHWGRELIQTLQNEGVNTDSAIVVEGETTGFSMIVNVTSGDRVVFYTPGTNAHLNDATFDRAAMTQADWIYLTSLQETSISIEDDIVRHLLERQGAGLTWNPGGSALARGMQDPVLSALLRQTDILLLNKEEARQFTGEPHVTDALRALSRSGARTVVITDGKEGALSTDGTAVYRCPVPPDARVVDTTGAGDAFGTGMTWARLQGMDLPECLCAGTVNATSVIGAIGAETALLTDTEMRERLRSIPLTVTAVAPL